MKAVRYARFGPPEVLEWTEVADPVPRANELLVKVVASGANPKDVLIRKGKMRWATWQLPRGCGYDFSGTVVKAAGGFREGDAVFGMINGFVGRTAAELVAVPLDEVTAAPANVPLEDCGGIALVSLTALQALRDCGALKPGMRVMIHGASGGVGIHAVQLAKILGAHVTASCSARNLELVRRAGADEVIDYATSQGDTGFALRQAQGEREGAQPSLSDQRFDVFFDAFGNQRLSIVRPFLTPRGRYVTTVPAPRNVLDHALTLFSSQAARLVVVNSNARDLALLSGWLASGQLKPINDRRIPMSQAAEAHRYLESKRARGKVLLLPG